MTKLFGHILPTFREPLPQDSFEQCLVDLNIQLTPPNIFFLNFIGRNAIWRAIQSKQSDKPIIMNHQEKQIIIALSKYESPLLMAKGDPKNYVKHNILRLDDSLGRLLVTEGNAILIEKEAGVTSISGTSFDKDLQMYFTYSIELNGDEVTTMAYNPSKNQTIRKHFPPSIISETHNNLRNEVSSARINNPSLCRLSALFQKPNTTTEQWLNPDGTIYTGEFLTIMDNVLKHDLNILQN